MTTETYEMIDAQARASARELLSQGWDPKGEAYDLGMYRGDMQALEERLARASTHVERCELERMIRDYLVTGA